MARNDPRLEDAAPGVPEQVRDRSIRHALLLERLKTQEANKVRAQLERAFDDVLGQIESRLRKIEDRGFDTGPAVTRRLQELASGIRETLDPAYQAQAKFLERFEEIERVRAVHVAKWLGRKYAKLHTRGGMESDPK